MNKYFNRHATENSTQKKQMEELKQMLDIYRDAVIFMRKMIGDVDIIIADGRRTTIYIVARQAPVARTDLLDGRSARMGASLVVVVDDTTESLIGIGTSDNPCAGALGLHIESGKNRSGIARQTSEIVGRAILGTVDGCRALQGDGGILYADTIAYGKLT